MTCSLLFPILVVNLVTLLLYNTILLEVARKLTRFLE